MKKKKIVIIVAIALVATLILVGVLKKKSKTTTAPKNYVEQESDSHKYEEKDEKVSAFTAGQSVTESRGSSDKADQVDNPTYAPVLDKLKENKEVDVSSEEVVISLTEGVSPAIVVSGIEDYRKKGMIRVPSATVEHFIDKKFYGQTLAKITVQNKDGGAKNNQFIFFACTDPIEIDKQLKILDNINIIASSLDMVTMNIHDGDNTYYNALVIFGNYSKNFSMKKRE